MVVTNPDEGHVLKIWIGQGVPCIYVINVLYFLRDLEEIGQKSNWWRHQDQSAPVNLHQSVSSELGWARSLYSTYTLFPILSLEPLDDHVLMFHQGQTVVP